jgi:hypothetical protein
MWRVSSCSHFAAAPSVRRERDRAADLDDHLGHRLAHAGDQLVELGQALGTLAVRLAHVQVQHGGAGVSAIDAFCTCASMLTAMSSGKSEGNHSGP